MTALTVTVMGAGNGGFATAADLALRGHRVTLFDLPDFASNLEPVEAGGGIRMDALEGMPRQGGFARLAGVTTDAGEALADAEVVLVVVPAFAHEAYADLVARHARPGQAVVVTPSYLGILRFASALAGRGRDTAGGVLLGDTESMIYACRKTAPDRVWVRGYKRGMRAAALPARRTPELLGLLHRLYDDLEPAANVLETGLSNANAIIHTPLMLMNAAPIEREQGEFLFYHEGMTPIVGRLIEALDADRLRVGRAWGLNLRTMYQQDLGWYGHQGATGENIHDTHVTNPIYAWSKAPGGFEHRYVQEDIPYGLVPMEDLARRVGVPAPVIGAMIEIFGAVMDTDFRAGGRTLDRLGLAGRDRDQILETIAETGRVPRRAGSPAGS